MPKTTTKARASRSAVRANARAEVKLAGHVLRADFNALCDFEDIAGKAVSDLDFGRPANPKTGDAGAPAKLSMRDVRALVQAFAGIEDETEAGALIQSAGVGPAVQAVGEALSAAFGTDKAPNTETVNESQFDADDAGEA